MNWYLKCWKQYADFSGRARRKECWMFTLFNAIIILALVLITVMMQFVTTVGAGIFAFLYVAYLLATLIPGLAVAVRRLHDVGKSGWWYLIGFVPLVGVILLIVWFCTDGQPGENKWGANPKGI